jgi:hypothetical protein
MFLIGQRVGFAERSQVAGSLADEVLARQAGWHLRAASRKTASPSTADVFPHCVRFALNLVQLMFDNIADADDAAKPAVLLDHRNVRIRRMVIAAMVALTRSRETQVRGKSHGYDLAGRCGIGRSAPYLQMTASVGDLR